MRVLIFYAQNLHAGDLSMASKNVGNGNELIYPDAIGNVKKKIHDSFPTEFVKNEPTVWVDDDYVYVANTSEPEELAWLWDISQQNFDKVAQAIQHSTKHRLSAINKKFSNVLVVPDFYNST